MICRLYVLLSLLLIVGPVTGQTVSIRLNNNADSLDNGPCPVGKFGTIPASYWRFRAGDSLAWASPTYPDARWQRRLAPDEPIVDNKALHDVGKGWFRLPFRLSDNMRRKPMNLVLKQFGETDIYLDGQKLASLHPDQIDSSGSQRLLELVPLPVTDTNQHVLAIRYAFTKQPVAYAEWDEEAFSLSIQPQRGYLWLERQNKAIGIAVVFFAAGLFTTLSLLHFLFFRANRQQRINRTLGWAMLFFTVSCVGSLFGEYIGTIWLDSATQLLSFLTVRIAFLLLLVGVYQYLNRRVSWFFWGVVVLLLGDFLYRAIRGDLSNYVTTAGFLLLLADYARLSWIGRKQKQADSRLPWLSLRTALLSLIGVVVVVIIAGVLQSVFHVRAFDGILNLLALPLLVATILSIPVGLSLSLVQDYTRTYRSLAAKLTEVEQLSARTLAQEQEKQVILAQQNETLEQQVQERTAALNQSLTDLRATQNQLIQREKLASLGELTAGVAHEIQNPLNFVNNFSDVSVELIDELEEEQTRAAGERDEGLEREIMADIKQNVSKISEHGKRAASIVRGMLEHSRASTGERTPTNLNALADEYLKLAYHGLRANDKTFEVSLVTHFDPALPNVPVVAPEIGRVLMNLFTNAFHAVRERTQKARQQGDVYTPTVTLTTEPDQKQVRIRIHDNGLGIPDELRTKIFQPFFTTKPTGQGTGLGLSISYDIITKGHGGTLTLTSEPNTFTEFVVALPV